MKKKIGIALLAIFIVIQFIRPTKNLSGDETYAVSTKYNVPDQVSHVLQSACNDCHSNKTNYPWYAEVQPFGWWMSNHVNEGKKELNLSEFTKRPLAIQNHKFEETIEMVKEGDMPLPSYTWLGRHSDAKLTAEQKKLLTDWAEAQMDYLKATYPADSLVRKKRNAPPKE